VSLVKIINDYRDAHKAHPEIIHLLGDFEVKLCLVWSSRLCHRADSKTVPKPPKGFPAELKWDWLWSHYNVHFERWVELAGYPVDEAFLNKARRIIDLQMVYPDGSLHDWIARTLKTKALSSYNRMHKSLVKGKQSKQQGDTSDEADAA